MAGFATRHTFPIALFQLKIVCISTSVAVVQFGPVRRPFLQTANWTPGAVQAQQRTWTLRPVRCAVQFGVRATNDTVRRQSSQTSRLSSNCERPPRSVWPFVSNLHPNSLFRSPFARVRRRSERNFGITSFNLWCSVEMHFCLLFLSISHCLCIFLKLLYTTMQEQSFWSPICVCLWVLSENCLALSRLFSVHGLVLLQHPQNCIGPLLPHAQYWNNHWTCQVSSWLHLHSVLFRQTIWIQFLNIY